MLDLHGKEFMQIRVSHRRRQVIPERASAEGVSGTCFDLAGIGQIAMERRAEVRGRLDDRMLSMGRADGLRYVAEDRELRARSYLQSANGDRDGRK